MRRRSSKNRNFTIRTGVTPTKERRRQNGGVIAEIIDRDANGRILIKRYRALWECPLDAYLGHKAITEREYRAGLKFCRAYHRAILSRSAAYRRLSSSYGHQGPTQSDRVLKDAYQTLSSYYKAAIIDICGHDLPARDEVKLDRLRKGLGQLADLWKGTADELFS